MHRRPCDGDRCKARSCGHALLCQSGNGKLVSVSGGALAGSPRMSASAVDAAWNTLQHTSTSAHVTRSPPTSHVYTHTAVSPGSGGGAGGGRMVGLGLSLARSAQGKTTYITGLLPYHLLLHKPRRRHGRTNSFSARPLARPPSKPLRCFRPRSTLHLAGAGVTGDSRASARARCPPAARPCSATEKVTDEIGRRHNSRICGAPVGQAVCQ